jgi:N6-L-threonylcarbamoyladenine synthase
MAGKGYVFSFSGLKTAVMRVVEQEKTGLSLPDLCAGLQLAVAETFVEKCEMGIAETGVKRLVLAGGVAANAVLRENLQKLAQKRKVELLMPTIHLCTDNAAMIAAHGFHTAAAVPGNSLQVNAVANWEMGSPFHF